MVANWTTPMGMPTEIDGLLREEWSILVWLAENVPGCDQAEYEAIMDLLIANGERLSGTYILKEDF